MAESGRGYDVTDEEIIQAVESALQKVAPRPVVDSAEVERELDQDLDPQTVRNRLKEIRHISNVSGYQSMKWLWWIDENEN